MERALKYLIDSIKKIKISKKEKVFLVILGILFVYAVLSQLISSIFFRPTAHLTGPTTKITINNHTYNVLTATSPTEQARGLMYVTKPVPFDGMQFIYQKAQVQYFWNKNTHLDLTIYWMDDDKVLGTADLPSIDHAGLLTITSPKPANKVVEIIK